jgi:predicted DNA-binding protein (MmcQ/YjbR family)
VDASDLRTWCLRQPGAIEDKHPAIRPGYHLNKRHWNTIALDGSLPDQLIRDLIEDFYDLVVSALPKRVRDELGWVR